MKKTIIVLLSLFLYGCGGFQATIDAINPFSDTEIETEETKTDRFNKWLKRKNNYRNFTTQKEAEDAFDKYEEEKRQQEEWSLYKKEIGITRN